MIEAPSRKRIFVNVSLAALLILGAGAAGAHGTEEHAEASPGTADTASVSDVRVLDLELTDQNGQPQMFRDDVIGDRIVVMDFIYTSCTTVCPVVSAILGQVAQRLGDRLGRDVFLVSLSVDPVTDRPARLRAYAQKQRAGEGWIWLTGKKLTVDKVLEGLGAYSPAYEEHPSMMLVGDGQTGEWTRFFGFPAPDKIIAEVDALSAARAHAATVAQ